jgi:hypothetical protein
MRAADVFKAKTTLVVVVSLRLDHGDETRPHHFQFRSVRILPDRNTSQATDMVTNPTNKGRFAQEVFAI